MNFELSHTIDSVKDGTKEAAEIAHKKTSEFHENYVSKVIPDCGKYGDVAKFAAELIPGVAEYNAIKAFATAAVLPSMGTYHAYCSNTAGEYHFSFSSL